MSENPKAVASLLSSYSTALSRNDRASSRAPSSSMGGYPALESGGAVRWMDRAAYTAAAYPA